MPQINAQLVHAPPVVPSLAGTLLAAAYTPADMGLRDGVQYAVDAVPVTGWSLSTVGCSPVDVAGVVTADPGTIGAGTPFQVYVEDACTTFSRRPVEVADRAGTLLAAVTSAAIAREFQTAQLAAAASWQVATTGNSWVGEPRLEAAGVTDLNAAGAVTPVRAVGLLEDWLGSLVASGAGVIHGTRRAVTSLYSPAGLRREGNLILTAFDTRVVGDPGYTGQSPAGAAAAAGESWLYATARPVILTSPVVTDRDPVSTIDRSVNRVTSRAWRLATLILPVPQIAAVRVTL